MWVVENTKNPEAEGNAAGQNVTDLKSRFTVANYLTPHSDAVALLVLAHQTYVHNLITAAGYQARSTPGDTMRIEGAAERLVRAMLFAKEALLPGAGTALGTRGHLHVDTFHQLTKTRVEAIARLRQRDLDFAQDPAGVAAEYQDAVAHQDRLFDVMRD